MTRVRASVADLEEAVTVMGTSPKVLARIGNLTEVAPFEATKTVRAGPAAVGSLPGRINSNLLEELRTRSACDVENPE